MSELPHPEFIGQSLLTLPITLVTLLFKPVNLVVLIDDFKGMKGSWICKSHANREIVH